MEILNKKEKVYKIMIQKRVEDNRVLKTLETITAY